MGSHNEFSELFTAKAAGENHLVPPATGETIDLQGKDGSLVLADTSSSVTYLLPASTPFGVTVYVSNRSTGTITVQNPSSVTVDTVSDGEIKGFISAGDNTWNTLGGVSATQLAGVTSTTGANLVGFDDSGSKTSAATVGNALDELYVAGTGTGKIPVPLTSITLEDGTPMTKQATTVAGFNQLGTKNIVIDIPINCTTEAYAASSCMPADANLDGTTDDQLVLNVIVSKSADNDSDLTFDAELYALGADPTEGWSNDGYSGTAVAIPDNDVNVLQFAPGTNDAFSASINGPYKALSFVLTLGGTNDGDVVYIHDVYWTYRKKLLTA